MRDETNKERCIRERNAQVTKVGEVAAMKIANTSRDNIPLDEYWEAFWEAFNTKQEEMRRLEK